MRNVPRTPPHTPTRYNASVISVELRVPGMTCSHCVRAVESEVQALDGVDAVRADLETKLVTVHGASVNPDAVRAAIEEAGYEAE